jgi:pyruvate,orthophosphate dikinase
MAKKLVRTKTSARAVSRSKAASRSKAGSRKAPARAAKAAPAARGKYVYLFGRKTDGNGSMKALLGGKGANLAEMCRIGLPVPPGFTITTEVCTYYYANRKT